MTRSDRRRFLFAIPAVIGSAAAARAEEPPPPPKKPVAAKPTLKIRFRGLCLLDKQSSPWRAWVLRIADHDSTLVLSADAVDWTQSPTQPARYQVDTDGTGAAVWDLTQGQWNGLSISGMSDKKLAAKNDPWSSSTGCVTDNSWDNLKWMIDLKSIGNATTVNKDQMAADFALSAGSLRGVRPALQGRSTLWQFTTVDGSQIVKAALDAFEWTVHVDPSQAVALTGPQIKIPFRKDAFDTPVSVTVSCMRNTPAPGAQPGIHFDSLRSGALMANGQTCGGAVKPAGSSCTAKGQTAASSPIHAFDVGPIYCPPAQI